MTLYLVCSTVELLGIVYLPVPERRRLGIMEAFMLTGVPHPPMAGLGLVEPPDEIGPEGFYNLKECPVLKYGALASRHSESPLRVFLSFKTNHMWVMTHLVSPD